MPPHSRYRSLDLLRSVAILMVLVAHTVFTYGAPDHLAPLQLGGTGVDLFFVLSGWLLGGQLFKEGIASGGVDVRRFWLRRWMRTFPAYYAVLCASLAQRYLTKEGVEFPIEYFVFAQNYFFPLEFFTISWSLAVEEQFYLFIAPFIALTLSLGRRRLLIVFCCLLSAPLLFRLTGSFDTLKETHVRLDGCVFGVMLAFLHHRFPNAWSSLAKHAPAIGLAGLLTFSLFLAARYNPHWNIGGPDKLLLAFVFGSWVLLANSGDAWRRALYLPGAHYVATRSYAMYLLHPEALAALRPFTEQLPFSVFLTFGLLLTCALSEILYRLIELPFMRMRERFPTTRSVRAAA